MARRGLLVLAVVAALLGAPQVASAAANALSSPSAAPTTGTTATVFTLRVRYDGQFPATGVTAVVGSRVLAMSLVAGSASSGSWSVATTLPPGTWPVQYAAVVVKGNAPSLSGPSINVQPLATAAPTPVATVVSGPLRSGTGGQTPTSGGDSATPQTPAQAPAAGTPAPAPDAEPAGPPVTDGGGRLGGDAASEAPVDGRAPSTSAPVTPEHESPPPLHDTPEANGAPTGSPDTTDAMPEGGMAGTDALRSTEESPNPASADEDVLAVFLLLGLSGVMAVALVGSAVLALGRRRRSTEEAAPAGEAANRPTTGSAGNAAEMARRSRRMARAARLDDDPILASLGVGRRRSPGTRESKRTKSKDGS